MPSQNYDIEITDVAEMEARAAQAWYADQKGTDYANHWYAGLLDALESLAIMPNRCPVAEESSSFGGLLTIRQHLYGTKRNRYRLLFAVIEELTLRSSALIKWVCPYGHPKRSSA